ncbi:TVP38/TMEM64 family protein [Deinococcus pimensis]|uniref:TVP38/TMEM64 family protein n=1 Tax=Deinococcus pimensis TaxID=309888 RepID=UPI0004B7E697|nr:VTT domain-containing protein [Deinococcus pimensis]
MSDGLGSTSGRPRREVPEWLILLALVLTLGLVYALVPSAREATNEAVSVLVSGDRERIGVWVQGFGAWGPLTLLALNLLQTVLAFIPALPIMVVAVLAYGPVWGALLAWAGLLAAASLGYGLGKVFGDSVVRRHLRPESAARVRDVVERYGLWAVAVTRLTPLVPTDAVSILAGVAGMGFWRFLLASAAGTAPVCLLLALFGESFERLLWALGGATLVAVAAFLALRFVQSRRAARSR